MIFLELSEVMDLQRRLIERTGGLAGVRDLNLVESAIAQPRMTFADRDLYPTLPDKAAALAFSLIRDHGFIDGNKRIGHAAMETFLMMNGFQIDASVDEQESVVLNVAAGKMDREALAHWLASHTVPFHS